MVASTSFATIVAGGTGRWGGLLRDHVAVPLLNCGWLQHRIVEKTSQLQVSYRRGPLGDGHRPPARGIRAGDRMPNHRFARPDGSVVRLHDMLGPQWALLDSEQLAQIARSRLGDVVRLCHDGRAVLVRPDGHAAWRGNDPRKLSGWLDTVLGRRATVQTCVADSGNLHL